MPVCLMVYDSTTKVSNELLRFYRTVSDHVRETNGWQNSFRNIDSLKHFKKFSSLFICCLVGCFGWLVKLAGGLFIFFHSFVRKGQHKMTLLSKTEKHYAKTLLHIFITNCFIFTMAKVRSHVYKHVQTCTYIYNIHTLTHAYTHIFI